MFKIEQGKKSNHLTLNFFRRPLANPHGFPVIQLSILFPLLLPWEMNQEDIMCQWSQRKQKIQLFNFVAYRGNGSKEKKKLNLGEKPHKNRALHQIAF